MTIKKCPKCGHPMTTLSKIGLKGAGPDAFVCSMNMPYSGCGYQIEFVSQSQKRRLEHQLQ